LISLHTWRAVMGPLSALNTLQVSVLFFIFYFIFYFFLCTAVMGPLSALNTLQVSVLFLFFFYFFLLFSLYCSHGTAERLEYPPKA
jgi:Ca2+/Na+ antiporter